MPVPGEMLALSLETLAKIDNGRIREAFELELQHCYADCADRPALEEARKVTITASLVPVPDDRGTLDTVRVRFQVQSTQPKRTSKHYEMRAQGGALLWNELSPDAVKQMTIDQAPGMKAVPNAG